MEQTLNDRKKSESISSSRRINTMLTDLSIFSFITQVIVGWICVSSPIDFFFMVIVFTLVGAAFPIIAIVSGAAPTSENALRLSKIWICLSLLLLALLPFTSKGTLDSYFIGSDTIVVWLLLFTVIAAFIPLAVFGIFHLFLWLRKKITVR